MKAFLRRLRRVLWSAIVDWWNDDAQRMGAALAYYTVFSLAPLLVIATVIAGQYFGRAAVEGRLYDQVYGILGDGAARLVSNLVAQASQPRTSIIATVIGVVTILFGASGIFVNLQGSLNTVWRAPQSSPTGLAPFLRSRLTSFAMVLGVGFLLLLFLLADTALTVMSRFSREYFDIPGVVPALAGKGMSLAALTALFAVIFKVLPNARIGWRDVWVGSLVTAVLFMIGESLIALYLSYTSVASAYGAAGSLVAILVWVYYSAQIVLFGAEFTEAYAREFTSGGITSGHRPAPRAPRKPESEIELLTAQLRIAREGLGMNAGRLPRQFLEPREIRRWVIFHPYAVTGAAAALGLAGGLWFFGRRGHAAEAKVSQPVSPAVENKEAGPSLSERARAFLKKRFGLILNAVALTVLRAVLQQLVQRAAAPAQEPPAPEPPVEEEVRPEEPWEEEQRMVGNY